MLEPVKIRDETKHNTPILGSNTWRKNLDKSILEGEIPDRKLPGWRI